MLTENKKQKRAYSLERQTYYGIRKLSKYTGRMGDKMTGNVKVTMKKKMGICVWVGCMILIAALIALCLMAAGRNSVYIDGTFVQHSGDSAEAFLRPAVQTEKAAL